MTFSDSTSTSSVVVQGGAATLAICFIRESFMKMIPFLFVALLLIIVDLYFGIRAARTRNEKIRVSRAVRRTVGKFFDYICWLLVSSSLAVAFSIPAIEWVILGIVMGNEIISISSNFFLSRGQRIKGLDKMFIKWLGEKANIDTSCVKIEDIEKDVEQAEYSLKEEHLLDKNING
jgi:hypothetical protein